MAIAEIDKEALRRRYDEERDKRLRSDGARQYIGMTGRFAHFLEDPYQPVVDRPPVTDDVTFAFVGGGFAGLLVGAGLKKAGVEDVRILDRAGDFGGTWYWNRYPGAMCDTASLVYMPLLEETGHMPSEKYAHGPEILEHCRRIGRHFGLYDHALFHTEVTGLAWDADRRRWVVTTDRGDRFTAQFVGIGTGPFPVPKLPGLEGIDDFEGHSFHTSRWDYAYSGGDPSGTPMELLADKRVAIVGTGATAVQCVPELARTAQELFVFQRTPSSVDVRGNGPLDPEWFASIATPGWQQRWLENFTANWEGITGRPADDLEDLVQDGWTDLARRVRAVLATIPPGELSLERALEAYEDADFAKMEEIRARVDALVEDPRTAAALKAWYRQLCKRPCFHDEYLQAYNRPNVHLVDTDGKGVERITARGVVANGVEHPVDCIVYGSGFATSWGFDTDSARFDLVGRGGRRLSEHWRDGMRTLHGLHVNGFPNAFVVQLPQGAYLVSNVPHNFVESAKTVAAVVSHVRRNGYRVAEATAAAEREWVTFLMENGRTFGNETCTPGYYNNEGQPRGERERHIVGYPGGASAFFALMEEWRSAGTFEGLAFS